MTNDHVIIKAKGQSWTLRMVPSAWIELEDAGLGNLQEIGATMQTAMSFRNMIRILLAALRWKHPEITEEISTEIADEIGSEELLISVTKVIQSSFPKSAKGAGGKAPAPAKAGTGISS